MNDGGWGAQRPGAATGGCSESADNIVAECPDVEICELKAQMQDVLDGLVAAERAEAQALEDALDNAQFLGSNNLAQAVLYTGAAVEGLWNGFVGLLSFAWGVLKGAGKLVYELGLHVNPLTAPEQFRQDIAALKEAHAELQHFTDEELETYVILMQDPDIHCMLVDFAGDMIAGQHSLEWTESGGTIAFDVILAVLTFGAGSAASARHLGKFKRLKEIIDKLAGALRRRAGTGGIIRGFSAAESAIIHEAKGIYASTQFAQLRAAHAAGESVTVRIGGRLIQYEPGLPASGMTMFGENGFLIGREAFSSEAELGKTILHELYRLGTSASAGGVSGNLASSETAAAFSFAERAIGELF